MDSDDFYASTSHIVAQYLLTLINTPSHSAGWLTNLADTEKGLSTFFKNCAEAGPRLCPFWSNRADDIRSNLADLYLKYRQEPLAVRTRGFHGIVDEVSIRKAVFSALYSPHSAWYPLAHALKELKNGNGLPILALTQELPYQCSCNPKAGEGKAVWDSVVSIVCNDGDPVPGSLEDVKGYMQELMGVSEWAHIWGSIRLGCM